MNKTHRISGAIFSMLTCALLAGLQGCHDAPGGPDRFTLDSVIAADTVLTGGSVYAAHENVVFQGDVTLEAGVTLVIDPGKSILFDQNLFADGTSNNRIIIKSSSDELYGEIRAQGDSASLKYVNFSYGNVGLTISAAQSYIEHNEFKNCELGVMGNRTNLMLDFSHFSQCATALRIEQSQISCSLITIDNCNQAMEFYLNRGKFISSTISNNERGLFSGDHDSTQFSYNSFQHNNIAIQYYYGYPVLRRNIIANNRIGIEMQAYPRWDVTIAENNILSNDDYSIYIYDVFFNNPHSLSIPLNWWGTTDSSIIAEKIRDGIDLGTADTLVFVPFANQAWQLP